MDFSRYDVRKYPTVSVQQGYGEWVETYEDTVQDVMDLRLLERIRSIRWDQVEQAADLACGTGRTGAWLKQKGAQDIDGVDLTAEMVEVARTKEIYRQLFVEDVLNTPLAAARYDLVTMALADEHLPSVRPLYKEVERITHSQGYFVIVGYHPYFLLNGVPTHFHRVTGEPVTIQCYIHLFSDHAQAALEADWSLIEMHEGIVDEECVARKPNWERYMNWPFTFALVWRKQG